MTEGSQSPVGRSQIAHVSVLRNGASFRRKGCSNSGRGENVLLSVVKRNIQHMPLGKCAGFRPAQSKYPVLCSSGGCLIQRGGPASDTGG